MEKSLSLSDNGQKLVNRERTVMGGGSNIV